jgi:DNA-binding transcriptional MocR family regulator
MRRKERCQGILYAVLGSKPTGNSISLSCAHRVLQAASRFGFYVIDDDAFSDLFPASAPRLASLGSGPFTRLGVA